MDRVFVLQERHGACWVMISIHATKELAEIARQKFGKFEQEYLGIFEEEVDNG